MPRTQRLIIKDQTVCYFVFIEIGIRGFIDFVRETLTGPWLDIDRVPARLKHPYRLRLI